MGRKGPGVTAAQGQGCCNLRPISLVTLRVLLCSDRVKFVGVVTVDLVLHCLPDETIQAAVLSFAHAHIAVGAVRGTLTDGDSVLAGQLPSVKVESAFAFVEEKVALGGDRKDVEGHGGFGGGRGGVTHNVTRLCYTEKSRGKGHRQRNRGGHHGEQASVQKSWENGKVLDRLV